MIDRSSGLRLMTAAALCIAAPLPALSAGFALKEQSVSGQGTSFAGITAGGNGDASAMFFNPAAMGLAQGHELVQTFTYIGPHAEPHDLRATRAAGAGGTPIAGNADPGDIAQDAVMPAGYAVYAVSPDLRIGISGNGPWGLVTAYPYDWVGRYHGVRSDLRTYNFTPTVSYRVIPEVILGAGLQVQYVKAKLSAVSDAGLALGRPGALDVTSDLKGDDLAFGATAGLIYRPAPGTRFGLSYRSPVFHKLEGDISFTGVPPTLSRAFPASAAHAKLTTPEVVSFGAYHELSDRWAVMADVQWTNWSRFKELRVSFDDPTLADSVTEERWNDSWFVSAGAAYRVSDRLTLRTGVAFDRTPMTDEFRTPRIPDENRYWLSVGAGYQITDSIRIDAAYTHIFVSDAKLSLTDDLTGPERGRGTLTGRYENHVNLLGVQARFTF
ncbi:OmpP1/FadL family transporter [Azospirillum halopraeferens]|uniref:OmpP1/FadL family transporter n=1 Tax=Azospirillum halopraeferens TaxID=34010 RepID=UPI00040F59A8|nr:outer membrane protein transport protein [Azospirillum halopraeferens]